MIKPVARNFNFSCCSQISSTVVWYVHPTAWHISHCFPIWQLHNGVNFSRPYLSVTSVSSLQFPISKLEVRVQITACVSELLILWSHSGLGEQITYAGSFYVKRLGRRSVNTQQSVPKRDNMAWFKQWVSSPRCSPFGNSRHYIYTGISVTYYLQEYNLDGEKWTFIAVNLAINFIWNINTIYSNNSSKFNIDIT
jgi:hypothetical protein